MKLIILVFLLAGITYITSAASDFTGENVESLVCSAGWVQNGKKCFKLFTQGKTFDDAENICKTYDGHLASVTSKPEHGFLLDYILRDVKETELKYVWVGGRRKKTRYIWMDLEPFVYSDWHSTFLDVQKYPLNNCIQFATAAGNYEADQAGFGKFLLQPCTGKDNFICQKPMELSLPMKH